MSSHYLQKIISLLALSLLSFNVYAVQWVVEPTQSQLTFVSTKKTNIAEVHRFNDISGQVNAAGRFVFDVNLMSVDTGIGIRDDRMREFLFNVVQFPKATLEASVEPSLITDLAVGSSTTTTIDADFSFHGKSQALALTVLVTKLTESKLLVVAAQPVILNVADYDLVTGVEKLRELAGLPSISQSVPVSFYLTLNASN